MDIGEFLKENRVKTGLSQSDLSKISGITEDQICRIETGITVKPRRSTLKILSTALNVDYNEFLKAAKYPILEITTKNDKIVEEDNPKITIKNPPIEVIIQETSEKTNKKIDILTEMLKKVYEDDLKEELPHIEGSLPVKLTNKTIKYPVISDKIACGYSLIPAEDEVDDWIELPEVYAVNAEIVLRAKGGCLDNEEIHDGYLVFIKCQNTASTGDIVAVRVIENSHGHAILKKLRIVKDNMFLTDKTGDIIEFKENMSIVGKAVYWMPDPRKFG